jgi:glycosyltransferase involved in cell wall biosynthesis
VHQPIDGGVARHVVDLFEGLTPREWEVILCGPAIPSASLIAAVPAAEPPHVPLALTRSIDARRDVRALLAFARIVRRVRPDVIHAHSSKAGAVARLAKPLNPSVPVLYTPHGYAFAGYFETERERRIYRGIERAMARLARFVVAVCEAEGRLAASVGPAERVRVVHNGIGGVPQESGSDPAMQALAARGPLICTLTQLRPGKGVETLIDALPALVAKHPRVQVAIVGDGGLRQALIERARSLGVGQTVHFLGERPEPFAVLTAAGVFVMTSWAEAFPYVILEAMAAGLPIVASDVGGIAEAIQDGRTGLLVPVRDPQSTADALIALLDDPALGPRLGAQAHETATRRFSTSRMIDGVTAVYREALSRASPT